jgi:hypothetical protein
VQDHGRSLTPGVGVALERLGGSFVSSHYATAVNLLAMEETESLGGMHGLDRSSAAFDTRLDDLDTRPPTPEEVARAQAHATLALVNVAEKLLAELTMLRQHLTGE